MAGNKLITLLLAGIFALLIWERFSPQQQSSARTPSASPNDTPYADSTQALEARIATLEADLSSELLQRQKIERRLIKLEEASSGAVIDSSSALLSEQESASAEEQQTEDESSSLTERLLSAGLPQDTIEAIQQTVDTNRMAMLQLRDRAVREGWSDTQEFSEKMSELRDASEDIREQFGDELYDQYLYASGRPNRVVVREVYRGSAADLAGLQAGDIITSYASSNIYSMSELRQGTVEGNSGEMVLLEVWRDDSPVTTSVPRGPLGISMSTSRIQP